MKNILVDSDVHQDSLDRLRALPGIGKVDIVNTQDESYTLPSDLISDKHILFCEYPPQNISDMKNLELLQLRSAGYSQLFGLGLADKMIRVCNARGVQDVPIAEWCIAMLVNLARDLRSMIRNQDDGVWDRSARFQKEIRGSVVGIWGYGGLGRQTARLAKALGLSVYVLDVLPIGPIASSYYVPGTGDPDGTLPDKAFLKGEEQQFLSELDYLILTMPLTKNTEGIVGEEELQTLPNTAYLLNPARGPLVKENALLKALDEGWIAGAALDTHYYYPMPADHPLWRFPNVIMTPHISGSTGNKSFSGRIWDVFLQNTRRLLMEEPLLNQLTAAQLNGE